MNMKKITLAGFVVVTFIVYSLNQRNESSAVVVTPTSATTPSSPTTNGSPPMHSSMMAAAYKDGAYTGSAADAIYGYIQVKATVKDGKLTDVEFLQYCLLYTSDA